MFVKFKYHAGYVGTEGEEIIEFKTNATCEDELIEEEIKELDETAYEYMLDNAETYSHLHFGYDSHWDGTEEEYETAYEEYLDMMCEVTWEIMEE